ncbi:hypothetical protein BO82DRAFT_77741 [Aspergillus uvarum CBS 121591]|uniref:Uncharacterized protein n=1 Tax=Aspergillus uvarum CBS 121591 TaxID=1448315 RepID=A0A319CE92_9EURO|nr:hypothetical protein BO82DRAFT_77741 [Aspergillus uvarum CBS 121591]PYH81677.1 hypothetical protein BO82DRAFT_77741 [Aspergillus uvarum CBS 121591]
MFWEYRPCSSSIDFSAAFLHLPPATTRPPPAIPPSEIICDVSAMNKHQTDHHFTVPAADLLQSSLDPLRGMCFSALPLLSTCVAIQSSSAPFVHPLSLPFPPLPTISLLISPCGCALSAAFGCVYRPGSGPDWVSNSNLPSVPSSPYCGPTKQNACSPAWVDSPLPPLGQVPALDSCSALLSCTFANCGAFTFIPKTQTD